MNKFRGIVFTDCDGVLSDGVWYFDSGITARKFLPEDGHGVYLLREAGFETIILSGESDPNIQLRADKLGIPFYHTKDKLAMATRIIQDPFLDLGWDQIGFIGNDVMDIPLLSIVGHPACPVNAHFDVLDLVREKRGFVSRYRGGDGAFREFAELIRY